MSPKLELPTIDAWSLAARLASAPEFNIWAVLGVHSDRVEAEAADVTEQLASLLDIPVEMQRVDEAQQIVEIVQAHQDRALVLVGLDHLDAEGWRWVDGNRSRLSRNLPVVMVVDEATLPAMVEHAPNLWSWVGGSAWRSVSEEGLSEEQREQRLSALREHFGFGDEELVRRAEEGTLAPEPDLAEWLVLIGKGHLIGR